MGRGKEFIQYLLRPKGLNALLSNPNVNPYITLDEYGKPANIINRYPPEFGYIRSILQEPPNEIILDVHPESLGFGLSKKPSQPIDIPQAARYAFLLSPYEAPEEAFHPGMYSPLMGITTAVAFDKTDFSNQKVFQYFSEDDLIQFLEYFAIHQRTYKPHHAPQYLADQYSEEAKQFLKECRMIRI